MFLDAIEALPRPDEREKMAVSKDQDRPSIQKEIIHIFSRRKGPQMKKQAASTRDCTGPGRLTMIFVTCRLTMIFFTYCGTLTISNYCRDVE